MDFKNSFSLGSPIKAGFSVVGVLVLLFSLLGSFYIVGGTQYAVERSPSGTMKGVVTSGVHFKVPFLSTVQKYDQFYTIAYQDDNDGDMNTHGSMKRISFADTYGGFVGSTIRYQILPDPEKLVAMHIAYLNPNNLMESGLRPVSNQLLAYTANQLTGEEYMQGGQNEYQNRIEDQGINGLYVTKREKVAVSKNASDVGLQNENPTKQAERESFVYVTNIQYDKVGNALRNPLPTARYGIIVVQATVDDFKPEDKLEEFVNRKKTQIATRQTLIEQQENERQSAVTAELKGTRERIESRQAMLKEKDAAVIEAQKKVELEQKEADLQIVRKKKELEISKANKGIQEANAIAAKYEADAIEFKGLAEANVKKAMYAAVKPDIFLAEVERDIQLAKYTALPNVGIQMPTNVMINNGSKGSSSIDDLASIQIIDKIGQMK